MISWCSHGTTKSSGGVPTAFGTKGSQRINSSSMFKLNFSVAIAAYLCFSIFLVFALWIFYNFHRNGILDDSKYLQQCPYCTHIFFDYHRTAVDLNSSERNKESSQIKGTDSILAKDTISRRGEKSRFFLCPRCHSYINIIGHHQEKGS